MRLYSALLLSLATLVLVVAPVKAEDAAVELQIEANGAGSFNAASAVVETGVKVEQTNLVHNQNVIMVDQDSGDNEIKNTTGGSASITTGKNKTEIAVVNQAGANQATVDPCGCEPPSVSTTIKDNGAWSKNLASTYVKAKSKLSQTNVVSNHNFVGVDQDSGDNEIKGTTGKKLNPQTITTGKNVAKVSVVNQSGANTSP